MTTKALEEKKWICAACKTEVFGWGHCKCEDGPRDRPPEFSRECSGVTRFEGHAGIELHLDGSGMEKCSAEKAAMVSKIEELERDVHLWRTKRGGE